MSDFDGGFVLVTVDPNVGETVHRTVRAYLERIGEPVARRSLVYATTRGARALWLVVDGEPARGKGRAEWPEAHADLAADLAAATGREAWAWSTEDQVGSEMIVGYDEKRQLVLRSRVSWDDEPEMASGDLDATPLETLRTRIGAWIDGEGVATATQSLSAAYDPSVLADYLLAWNPPKVQDVAGRVTLSVFLTQNILADATKLAGKAQADLGIVFWAAWETAKHDLCRKNAQDLEFPAGAPSPFVSPKQAPAALSNKERSTPDLIVLHVPRHVAEEVRALGAHLGVNTGRVVDGAFRSARERLWRGDAEA